MAGLGALLWLAQACLVTEKIDYDRPNTPAQLLKRLPDDFKNVPSEKDPACQKGWMEFRAAVRDVDVEDTLWGRLIIDHVSVTTQRVLVSGAPQRDDFSFCVLQSNLIASCLHVELLVSREFSYPQAETDPYATVDPFDVAKVEWWLLGPTDRFAEVGVSECQTKSEDTP